MDVRLHFEEFGRGFPLILLHGNGEDSSYFDRQVAVFADHFHVFAVDTRGHGKSERGNAPFTLEQFALDLRDFMDEHSISRAHLLGFSDGANIAMIFALKFPERVEKLVLNGGNLFPGGVKRSVQRPIEFGYWLTKLISKFDRRARAKHELLALMVDQPNLRPEDLAGLEMPALVIAGTDDMISEDHTRLIARSLPNGALCFIMGGHFIAHENPEPFNRAVLNFLLPEKEKAPRIPTSLPIHMRNSRTKPLRRPTAAHHNPTPFCIFTSYKNAIRVNVLAVHMRSPKANPLLTNRGTPEIPAPFCIFTSYEMPYIPTSLSVHVHTPKALPPTDCGAPNPPRRYFL